LRRFIQDSQIRCGGPFNQEEPVSARRLADFPRIVSRMTSSPSSRRHFLKTAAATVATFNIVPRHVLGGPRYVPPSEKVNVAIIGTGGQGRTNVRALIQLDDAQIIAVADPAAACR
jgi:hypothetical protein